MGSFSFCLYALLLVSLTLKQVHSLGIPVVICPSLNTAHELVYKACMESAPCRDLYDLSDPLASPEDAIDHEDLEFEKLHLGAILNHLDLVVPLHDATRRPNLVAPQIFPEERDRLLLDIPHYGSLYYDTTGRSSEDAWSSVAKSANNVNPVMVISCTDLSVSSSLRRFYLSPTISLLTNQRLVLDANAVCSDFNKRPLMDLPTMELHCQCPTDKVCGPPGMLNRVLLGILVGLFLLVILITIIALLASAIRTLDRESNQ